MVEGELNKLQASLNESIRKNSGYPERRRTTLDDELDEGTGTRPKTVWTTTLPTDMFENRKPEIGISVSKQTTKIQISLP